MKTMKRFASRLCAVLLVLTVGVTALVPAAFAAKAQLPSLPSDQCVVDDANVLSDRTTTTIENLNAQLTEQCSGAQIGVLTVEYTGSVSTEDYAVQAANAWGLGSSSNNNGVLILLVMQSPECGQHHCRHLRRDPERHDRQHRHGGQWQYGQLQ